MIYDPTLPPSDWSEFHHMNQFDILKIFLGFGMSTHVIHILPPIADATKNGISDQMMLECGMILDVTPNTVQPVQSQFCASLQLGTGQANKTDQSKHLKGQL